MLSFPRQHRVPAAVGAAIGVVVLLVIAPTNTRQVSLKQPVTAAASAQPKAKPPKPARAVTLAFAGDIHFEGALTRKLSRDPNAVLAPVAPLLRRADIAVVNLETAITTRGRPVPKQYNFRAPPSALAALQAAGVDAASMANNHGMDFGQVGLADSLAAAKAARFPVIGIGRNDDEAFRPYRKVVRGQRIAVIAATQVLDRRLVKTWTAGPRQPGLASAKDVARVTRAVKEARRDSDTVVVYLHWGVEGNDCPSSAQRRLADALVAAGADIVVGTHAHALQGAGRTGSAFVAYGLGNFAFYSRGGRGAQTGVLTLTVTGRRVDKYSWTPAVISGGVPTPLAGKAAVQGLAAWNALRACTDLAP